MSGIANLDYGEVQDILSGRAKHPEMKKGPKLGSKNKKTIPKESVSTTELKKRGRGRPMGSGKCSLCGETGHNKRTCLSCTDLPNSTK